MKLVCFKRDAALSWICGLAMCAMLMNQTKDGSNSLEEFKNIFYRPGSCHFTKPPRRIARPSAGAEIPPG